MRVALSDTCIAIQRFCNLTRYCRSSLVSALPGMEMMTGSELEASAAEYSNVKLALPGASTVILGYVGDPSFEHETTTASELSRYARQFTAV